MSENIFEEGCIFKYGSLNIGDGRSYTNKGYNTGWISSGKAGAPEKRAVIDGYDAEKYWDQMRTLRELGGSL